MTRQTEMEKMKPKSCVVTGANGFVGSRIADYLRNKGFTVYEMGRHKSNKLSDEKLFIPFELGKPVDAAVFRGKDALIHCAYDFRLTKPEDVQRINIEGSISILRAAKAAGVKKIIFISSFAAFKDAKSVYGKAKFAVEAEALRLGAVVVKPSMIFGKAARGMVGSLSKLVSMSNILPILAFSRQKLHLCHIEDLAALVFKIINENVKSTKPLFAASDRAYTLKEVLEILAKAKGKNVFFIPVPYALMFLCLRLAESIRLKIGVRSDSLLGLVHRNPNVDFTETRRLDVNFRKFDENTANE